MYASHSFEFLEAHSGDEFYASDEVDFITFASNLKATNFYNYLVSTLKVEHPDASIKSKENDQTSRCAFVADGKYIVVSRIGSTLLYATVDESEKAEFETYFSELHY